MAEITGTHEKFSYEAFWHEQDDQVYWGAVVTQDDRVVGRPKGHLMQAAISGDVEQAVRHVVETAIEKRLDVDRPGDPGEGIKHG